MERGTILEQLLLERNRLSELLAEGNSQISPPSIQERSPAAAAAAAADLQGVVLTARTSPKRLANIRFWHLSGHPRIINGMSASAT